MFMIIVMVMDVIRFGRVSLLELGSALVLAVDFR